ncbi:MAG: DUF2207 domain-containing protein [Actinomycetota bacterium]|nr:DUF2207 domain-containing protein [Actinomycetota bacterium]
MKRHVRGYLVGALVLAMLVLWPLAAAQLWPSSGDEVAEDTTITDYRGDFVVDANGTMSVTETVTVDFPDSSSQGIFRFFDSRDPNAPALRRVPEQIDVVVDPDLTLEQRLDQARQKWSDGYFDEEIMPDVVELYGEEEAKSRAVEIYAPDYAATAVTRHGWSERYTNLRIGSEGDRLPAGEHVYVIKYQMPSVLLPDGDRSRLYWNLVPSGWRQPIERATLSLTLPAESADVRCAVGRGATGGCSSVSGEGSTELEVTTGALDPGTPVTVSTDLDMAAPPITDEELPWAQRWDPVMGTDLSLATVLLALAAGLALPAVYLLFRTRDPLAGAQTRAMPPEGVGPAQAAYVLSKSVGPTLLASSVLYAASRGLVTIRSTQNGWRITVGEDRSWDGIDPVTGTIKTLDGVAIGASKKSKAAKSSGKRLSTAQTKMRKDLETWALEKKLLERRTDRFIWSLAFGLAAPAGAVLAVVRPGDTTLWALVPGVFAVLITPMLRQGAGLVRTEAGRTLATEALGFRQSLRSRSDDFHGDQARYDSYLPWAVGFGIADEWARSFRVLGGAALVVPAYLPYDQHALHRQPVAGDGGGDGLVSALTDDFERSLGSAIRSYEVSSTFSGGSSSGTGGSSYSGGGAGGGGGGFGGGGGGGDGGGGSW